MGLPGIVMVLADNQHSIARELESAGVAFDLGWYTGVTAADIRSALAKSLEIAETRAEMAHRGQQLVDGCGGQRVTSTIVTEQGGVDASSLLRK